MGMLANLLFKRKCGLCYKKRYIDEMERIMVSDGLYGEWEELDMIWKCKDCNAKCED